VHDETTTAAEGPARRRTIRLPIVKGRDPIRLLDIQG
jgi:hypothetical protein